MVTSPSEAPVGVVDVAEGVSVQPVTHGPKHHFFGYYDKCPWDRSDGRMLAMQIGFCDRQPKPGEKLSVGMVALDSGRYIELDQTAAWSWQQGTMLQWLAGADNRIIYNTDDGEQYGSVIRKVDTGRTRALPRPVYAVSEDGQQAVTLDFDRVHRLRPGYGYASRPEGTADDPAPADSGIWQMDLQTGASKLIVPLAWAAEHEPRPDMAGAHHWFNHLTFNPGGSRFIFLHRWAAGGGGFRATRLYTANADGSDVRLLRDDGMTSHYTWRDDQTILAWTRTATQGDHYYLIDDRTGAYETVGTAVLTQDGHCTFSPDGRWILTDTYWDADSRRTLILYRMADGRRLDLGRFFSPRQYPVECRCDLHPRWNRDGTRICIDSFHESTRQIYVVDVSAIVGS